METIALVMVVLLFLLGVGLFQAMTSPTSSKDKKQQKKHSLVIDDKYESIEEVQEALRKAGLEHSQLMLAIDCTQSNTFSGTKTFGACLHSLDTGKPNPYEEVITILGKTLSAFDADGMIPLYGFGDSVTRNRTVFNFNPDGSDCFGFEGVLKQYREVIPRIQMSGPTSFAPIIRKAIQTVQRTKEYTILVIIADGLVSDKKETEDAIVEASNYPLSILIVGVGDGEDFAEMEKYDDELPSRRFDNLQFVRHSDIFKIDPKFREAQFAIRALQEIPDQFKEIQRLNLL